MSRVETNLKELYGSYFKSNKQSENKYQGLTIPLGMMENNMSKTFKQVCTFKKGEKFL